MTHRHMSKHPPRVCSVSASVSFSSPLIPIRSRRKRHYALYASTAVVLKCLWFVMRELHLWPGAFRLSPDSAWQVSPRSLRLPKKVCWVDNKNTKWASRHSLFAAQNKCIHTFPLPHSAIIRFSWSFVFCICELQGTVDLIVSFTFTYSFFYQSLCVPH